jgi:hypothetical protein
LVVFENPEVECAATYLGAKLNVTDFGQRPSLGPEAFALSNAVRKLITNKMNSGWKIDLPTLIGVKATFVQRLLDVKGVPTPEGKSAYPSIVNSIEEKCSAVLRAPTRPPANFGQ